MKNINSLICKNIFCVLDTETTGLSPKKGDKLVEIAVHKIIVDNNKYNIIDKFIKRLNPERIIPYYVSKIHGIYTHMVENEKRFFEIAEDFLKFIGKDILIIQNASFDLSFLNNELNLCRKNELYNDVIDTVYLSKMIFKNYTKHNLDEICKRLDINIKVKRHSAEGDVCLTTEAFYKMRRILIQRINN